MSDTPAARSYANVVHREIVMLVVLGIIATGAFFGTRAAASRSREWRLRDADAWYTRGLRHMTAGDLDDAVHDLRKSAAMDRGNRTYRLALASALSAAGQDDSASQVLVGLREQAPEDAEINLQLARLAARRGNTEAALRYYHTALYGLWRGDSAEVVRRVRVELVRYLLSHGERSRALSELLVLAPNLSDDPRSHTEAGELFLDAGDTRRALQQFVRALQLDRTSAPAAAGAAEAAFAAGDYVAASQYLDRAPETDRTKDLRAVAHAVRAADPLAPRLPLRERQRRAAEGLAQASATLDACRGRIGASDAARGELDRLAAEARALQPSLTPRALQRSPEHIDDAVGLMYRVEERAAAACGSGAPLDRALLLIARRHDLDHP
jgi:Tfp pilus assembly protein PilF